MKGPKQDDLTQLYERGNLLPVKEPKAVSCRRRGLQQMARSATVHEVRHSTVPELLEAMHEVVFEWGCRVNGFRRLPEALRIRLC